jgi:hypothetical protein
MIDPAGQFSGDHHLFLHVLMTVVLAILVSSAIVVRLAVASAVTLRTAIRSRRRQAQDS